MTLVEISRRLGQEVEALDFAPPVHVVYRPLSYAAKPHELYLERYGRAPKEGLLLGMNPGPFGMAQTGIPFGDVGMVRDWLGIEAEVQRPAQEHPARPVLGFACRRGEVSGRRLWGWAAERFQKAETFFERFFVANYCPLAFVEESGRNRTPDKLSKDERKALFAACDRALAGTVAALRPRYVIGVGRFATERAQEVCAGSGVEVLSIPHPSPANPRANRQWAQDVDAIFTSLGLL